MDALDKSAALRVLTEEIFEVSQQIGEGATYLIKYRNALIEEYHSYFR
jgi:hypothetical protein